MHRESLLLEGRNLFENLFLSPLIELSKFESSCITFT